VRDLIIGALVVLGICILLGVSAYAVWTILMWFYHSVILGYTMPTWGWFVLVISICGLVTAGPELEEIGADTRRKLWS
jgi:hypothetical protein